ncbi:MAG: C10 family peptidase [Muribaculaceae bacterium]|nr:C10 family peptidase [Muribaculaceae bacterium]
MMMNLNRTVAVMLAMIAVITAHAAPVGSEQAQRTAAVFMSQTLHQAISETQVTMATKAPKRIKGTNTPAYYVFNAPGAFVVIAGDDRMPAVLGYSDSGRFDPNTMPDGLKELLECYAAQAAMLASNSASLEPQASGSVARTPIAPLLKSRWNQSEPYNLKCPTYNTSGSLCATGCVATAMAQVMNYYQWPKHITYNIPAYTSQSLNKDMPELEAGAWPDWNKIKNIYSASERGDEADAVSTLMLYVGQSLEMDYGPESGASTMTAASALADYFDYAPTARYVDRENYTTEGWSQLLYDELAAGRPILYRGNAFTGGGHAFVCDGIDADGLFHFNWGWGGTGDGYFLITRLNPNDQGTGSIVSNDGYIIGSAAVVGIQPNNPGETYDADAGRCLTYTNLSLTQTQYTRSSASVTFTSVSVGGGFWNYTNETMTYGFGYGLYDLDGNFITTLYSSRFSNLMPYYGSSSARKLTIPTTVASGTYYIKAICRPGNVGDWKVCNGGETSYIKADITATTLTLTPMGNAGAQSYTVNNVSYQGTLQKGRSVATVATLTNTGMRDFSYIYLAVDGKVATLAQCDIKPGETGEVLMHFTPSTAGSHTITLSLSDDGTQPIYSGTVSIASPVSTTVTFNTLSIDNLVSGTSDINDDKLSLDINAVNTGANAYNDYIVVRLYRHTTGNSGSLFKTVFVPVTLASGATERIHAEFANLDIDESYFATFSYYNNSTLTRVSGTSFYTIKGKAQEPQYHPYDVNRDGSVDVADINTIMHMLVTGVPFTSGNTDVNGDGETDIADINEIVHYLSHNL